MSLIVYESVLEISTAVCWILIFLYLLMIFFFTLYRKEIWTRHNTLVERIMGMVDLKAWMRDTCNTGSLLSVLLTKYNLIMICDIMTVPDFTKDLQGYCLNMDVFCGAKVYVQFKTPSGQILKLLHQQWEPMPQCLGAATTFHSQNICYLISSPVMLS